MNIFRTMDYKEILQKLIDGYKEHRGVISKLAEAAGCQRSYLSQVLNSHVHLTPDQALGVSGFFGLGEDETSYFLNLVDYARAGSPALKKRLRSIADLIRKKNEDLENRLSANIVKNEDGNFLYYSSWMWPAIHIAVSIPTLQTPDALAKHFLLPMNLVTFVLEGLVQMGLIEKKGNKYLYLQGERHLSKRSALVSMNHSNWRQRAVISSQTQTDNAFHYTGVSAISHFDFQILRDKFFKMTEENRKIISLSKEEELVCINIDFFNVK